MPIVNCPSCVRIVVIAPFATESTPCGECGALVPPPRIPPMLELTPDERAQMEGWERYLAGLRGGPPSAPEMFPDRIQLLSNAVSSGETWRVKRELADGADPNLCKMKQSTALHIAASLGHIEIIRILLARGADPGRLDGDGRTPQEVAAASGKHEVVALLGKFVERPMRFVRGVYPFSYALAGLCLPFPICWMMLIGGVFGLFEVAGGPFLGFAVIGHGCLWLFLRDRTRFEARSRFVAGTLCYGGFVWALIGLALFLLFLVMAPFNPNQATGELLLGCATIAVPSALLGGLGVLQYRATPGSWEDDPKE